VETNDRPVTALGCSIFKRLEGEEETAKEKKVLR
jgi:hypothetical protein